MLFRSDLVTRNPAAALGRRGKIGELKPRAHADFITVRTDASPAEALEQLVHTPPEITGVMIAGEWAKVPSA